MTTTPPQTTEPQELTTPNEVPTPTVGSLEAAIKEAVAEVRHCDEQAKLWLERKQKLQNKMNEQLQRIQKQFNNNTEEKKPAKPPRADKNATIPEIIRKLLEANGPMRTKDIRKYLVSQGRNTSPGVALSRMVEKGQLKHAGRGVYDIA